MHTMLLRCCISCMHGFTLLYFIFTMVSHLYVHRSQQRGSEAFRQDSWSDTKLLWESPRHWHATKPYWTHWTKRYTLQSLPILSLHHNYFSLTIVLFYNNHFSFFSCLLLPTAALALSELTLGPSICCHFLHLLQNSPFKFSLQVFPPISFFMFFL